MGSAGWTALDAWRAARVLRAPAQLGWPCLAHFCPLPPPLPLRRRLAEAREANVFMTDDVLSALMCAPRSTYPWDLVVTRSGDTLIFDKRTNSSLDFLTVRGWRPADGLGGTAGGWGHHMGAWLVRGERRRGLHCALGRAGEDARGHGCRALASPVGPPRAAPGPAQNGETAPDPLPEERDNVNGMQQLSMEATSVNQAFREQVRGESGGQLVAGGRCGGVPSAACCALQSASCAGRSALGAAAAAAAIAVHARRACAPALPLPQVLGVATAGADAPRHPLKEAAPPELSKEGAGYKCAPFWRQGWRAWCAHLAA